MAAVQSKLHKTCIGHSKQWSADSPLLKAPNGFIKLGNMTFGIKLEFSHKVTTESSGCMAITRQLMPDLNARACNSGTLCLQQRSYHRHPLQVNVTHRLIWRTLKRSNVMILVDHGRWRQLGPFRNTVISIWDFIEMPYTVLWCATIVDTYSFRADGHLLLFRNP